MVVFPRCITLFLLAFSRVSLCFDGKACLVEDARERGEAGFAFERYPPWKYGTWEGAGGVSSYRRGKEGESGESC